MSQFYGKTCILPMKRCHLTRLLSREHRREGDAERLAPETRSRL
jgi:hypothetical protein